MSITLRPYQQEAREAVHREWETRRSTLLVIPTGGGKTIIFSAIIEDCVRKGQRVLVLAHRSELLDQAADKLHKSTGLHCAVEKAEQSCIGSWFRVVVGSVQTLQREKRLNQFDPDFFDVIIIDEAHHALADGYRVILDHFYPAKVLGVTATPDRGDMKDLGAVFESLAYEYTLPRAVQEGYLSPIKAVTIPLKLDISQVGVQSGDYKPGELGTALDPYLEQIAEVIARECADRKTVIFLPLIATAQKMRDILNRHGMRAAEVNGQSADRAEVLADFDRFRPGESPASDSDCSQSPSEALDGACPRGGPRGYNVLCNAMLLTEGWDCPSVDCIVVLRPTKQRGLYCLDEQTEVLTLEGWKHDVDIGTEVAAFDPQSERIVFTPALAKIRRPLEPDEYFCSLQGPSVDIRVTNKHRMLYDTKRRSGWKFKTAENVAALKDGCYLPVSGHGIFKGVPLTDDELRFIGWVMTDGTINKHNNAITITQAAHQPWIEQIQHCIDGCNFKYRRFVRNMNTDYHRNSDCVCWTISKGAPRGTDKDKRGWGDLAPWLNKDISPLLHDMTERQFEVMLEAINLADGHKQRSKYWTQHSYHIRKGNKAFIEGLQRMAVQRGYRASFCTQTDTRGQRIWCVHLKKQSFVCIGGHYDSRPQWKSEKHSHENCWCVETVLGTLVTRRNGKVAIVGNCQMVGRGTRLHPGKEHLLLLDFLWHTERHQLCRPAHLVAKTDDVARKMVETMEGAAGSGSIDLMSAESKAAQDVVADREASLAKQLHEMRTRKRKLVDPLQFEMSIRAEDLSGYVPTFGWESEPPTDKQRDRLEKLGLFPDEVECAGKAAKLLERLDARIQSGLSTPKQIRFLEGKGFQHVGTWSFDAARKMIDRIAANGWRCPPGIFPASYTPPAQGAPLSGQIQLEDIL